MNTRQHLVAVGGLLYTLLGAAGPASAQSIEDRLRTQLRSTTLELRQLQDTQSQMQADRATAQQQRDKAVADLKQAQAELGAAKGQSSGQATAERALSAEKTSHAQDAQQLAKYRSAYEDLLALSRTHDGERSQAQAELKGRDTQLQTCEAKNAQLYQVGQEVLDAYEHVSLGSFFGSREPFAQGARVKYDGIAQRYGDQLYAGRLDPAAKGAAVPAPVPTPVPAAGDAAASASPNR